MKLSLSSVLSLRTACGPCGMKIELFERDFAPTSYRAYGRTGILDQPTIQKSRVRKGVRFTLLTFIMSKYWVISSRSMTSFGPAPGTCCENSFTVSRSPSTMALRCLAIPRPDRYLLSASASAAFTYSALLYR